MHVIEDQFLTYGFKKKTFAGAYDRDTYIKSKFEKSLKEFKLIEYLSS